MNALDEPTDEDIRVDTGRIGRMKVTLNALRSLRGGGTTLRVYQAIVDHTNHDRSLRTVRRDLLALEVIGLANRELRADEINPPHYWWTARWPTKDRP